MIELREHQTFFVEALARPTRYPAQTPCGPCCRIGVHIRSAVKPAWNPGMGSRDSGKNL